MVLLLVIFESAQTAWLEPKFMDLSVIIIIIIIFKEDGTFTSFH